MVFKTMSKVFVALVAICMALPVVAQTTTGGGKTKIVKPVFQDNDASQANYLKNRRALVGPGCTVNSLFDGVNVVAGVSNLQNLCNEDLRSRIGSCRRKSNNQYQG